MARGFFYGTFTRSQTRRVDELGGAYLGATRTARGYRLFSIRDVYPALARDPDADAAIDGELYELDEETWARVTALEPPEWQRLPVELADGTRADAYVTPLEFALRAGVEITAHGGWAAYLEARVGQQPRE